MVQSGRENWGCSQAWDSLGGLLNGANGTTRRRRLAWSRLVGLGPIDPGSNPGGPTFNGQDKQSFHYGSW